MGREELYPYAKGDHFRGMSISNIFQYIYHKSGWNLTNLESVSGEGSSKKQTAQLRNALPNLLKPYQIRRMLDIPCGDFYWMQQVDLPNILYTGADIVPELIQKNQRYYASEKRHFCLVDLTYDTLPAAELIFCRDCLVHLSEKDIRMALANIAASSTQWLLMTHFTDVATNKDIPTGGWRPLNFCQPPYNLPVPVALINEACSEMDGAFDDKCMALWSVDTIRKMDFLT